jgi:hypothetical protein
MAVSSVGRTDNDVRAQNTRAEEAQAENGRRQVQAQQQETRETGQGRSMDVTA